MFKKFSHTLFKRIILFLLFGFVILLMTINTPFNSSQTNKRSFSGIKQQTLHAEPSETQKEAVWTFLKSQDNFEEGWKTNYTSWLDLINKRKPQKTAQDVEVSTAVDLRSLWDVNPTTEYSDLNPKVKKTLSDLSSLIYKTTPSLYKIIIKSTLQYFSFAKETNSAVYELIKVLKANDRWTNLIKYQIKQIADVNIESLLLVQNIASLSGNKATYDNFSESVKISLRNLLDLDIRSSGSFTTSGGLIQMFSQELVYTPILNALGTRIDNVISVISTKAPDLWTFLKAENRLRDIKTNLIPWIGDVDVSPLHGVELTTSYENLSNDAKGTIFDLLQIPNYDATTIDNFIKYDTDIQAVWTFLKSKENFQSDWNTTTYPSWLDLIQKRKPQKTAWDGKVSAVINLVPLWDVNPTTEYSDLNPKVKKTLWELKQLSHSDDATWNYQNIIKFTLQYFSFGKETNSAVYDLITTLKENDRWSDLKEYRIKMIQDVDIASLSTLTTAEITALTGIESNYNNLRDSIKITLRNLLDLDVKDSPKFNDDVAQIFVSSTNYTPIINALKTRIDSIINQFKINESNAAVWTFLTTENRLQNIFQLKISQIAGVDITVLFSYKIDSLINYADLNSVIKEKLRLLSEISDYTTQIDFDIANNKAGDLVWTFLTTNDRLKNIKQYQIKTIAGVTLLPSLSSFPMNASYDRLTSNQKSFLISLIVIPDYNLKINTAIQTAQTAASDAWTFLKTNDRLKNLKQYQIKTIDTVKLLPDLDNFETLTLYNTLSSKQQTTLYALSQREDYQSKINFPIQKAQTIDSAWTFLTTNDRLTNIQQYKIETIDGISLLSNLANIGTATLYADLTGAQKTSLYTLSQRDDYQQKVTDVINIAEVADSAWTFLKNDDRLANLKQYQIKTINTIQLLPTFASVEVSTLYTDLSSDRQTLLYALAQRVEYQQKIIDAIQKAQIASDVLVFLKSENHLTNLQQYQIKTIDNIKLLPALASVTTSTLYTDLTFAQKTSLYALGQKANYQKKVTDVIQNTETVSFDVWIFLRENDRLANIKKYKIDKIETIALSPLWKIDPLSMNYINFLISEQKFTLDRLSKIMKYKAKIDTVIAQAKKQTLAVWNYLITTNVLKDIKKHEINKIADVDISSLMIANVKNTFDQQNDVIQDAIIKLKELSDYKLKIQNEIQKVKAFAVWTYLQKSKRLQNIKKYKITMINGIDVSSLKTANVDQDYTEQNNAVKKDLIALSKISSFENKIDQKIKNHTTIEDSNDRTLLTGIILLSLFGFLFLTTGTGFYVYKKFWIPKQKNLKQNPRPKKPKK